jgi:hypothetical protein
MPSLPVWVGLAPVSQPPRRTANDRPLQRSHHARRGARAVWSEGLKDQDAGLGAEKSASRAAMTGYPSDQAPTGIGCIQAAIGRSGSGAPPSTRSRRAGLSARPRGNPPRVRCTPDTRSARRRTGRGGRRSCAPSSRWCARWRGPAADRRGRVPRPPQHAKPTPAPGKGVRRVVNTHRAGSPTRADQGGPWAIRR